MKAQASCRMLWAAALCMLAADSVEAQFREPPPAPAYALQNATIVDAAGQRREGMTIVVRSGIIESIGRGTPVPADARVLAGDSLVVYPGLIDAHGKAAHALPADSIDRRTVKSWAPTREAIGFRPHRQIADHLTVTGSGASAQRRAGIVAVAVHPTEGLMPGQGALLLLRGDAVGSADMLLEPSLGPVFTLRSRRGFYPTTGMGTLAWYRQTFLDAARQTRIAQAASNDARGIGLPAFDRDHAVLQSVTGGAVPVWFVANTSSEIRQVLLLSRELDLRPVIVGGREAWKLADELKARDIAVLVSVDFTKPTRWKPESADSASSEPGVLRERRSIEDEYRNAGRLAQAGVRFALVSNGGEADLLEGTRKAITYGLSEAAALQALTITPASLLGVPALARLDVGAPANFLVANGPLFDKDTRVRYTMVAGVPEENQGGASRARGGAAAEAVNAAGTWSIETETPEGNMSTTLVLTQDGSNVTGTFRSEFGDAPVNGTINGSELSLTVVLNFGGQQMSIEMKGTIDGETASGTVESPMGGARWTGRRTSPGMEVLR